jgi:hypothetical protein
MDEGVGKGRRQDRPPQTIGELRRRLAELGDPWTVPEDMADDAPVPQAPHPEPVGPGHVPGLRAIDPDSDLEAVIREMAPSNAHLAQHRHEAGLPGPRRDTDDGDSPWGVG